VGSGGGVDGRGVGGVLEQESKGEEGHRRQSPV
jgi:hypothetical protein